MKYGYLRVLTISIVIVLFMTYIPPARAENAPGFAPGNRVMVSYQANQPLVLYAKPMQSADPLTKLPPGTIVTLTKGPVNDNGKSWWHIRGDSGQGWILANVVIGGKQVPTFAAATPELLTAAVSSLTASIKRAPAAATYVNRGLLYYGQRNYALALTDLSDAIKRDSKLAPAYNSRGLVYLAMHSFRMAIDDFSQAMKLEPSEAVFPNSRGRAYLGLENFRLALQDFDLANRLNPSYVTAVNNYQYAYNRAYGFSNTARALTKLTEQDPDNAEVWLNLAETTSQLQSMDRAEPLYQRAIDADPTNPGPYVQRGFFYLNGLRNQNAAMKDFEQAIKVDPTFPGGYLGLGAVYDQQKDYQQGIAQYTKALEQDPYRVGAYISRAEDYRLIKDYAAGIKDAQKALEIEPNMPCACAYYALGDIYYDQGNFQQALENYQKAVSFAPNREEAKQVRQRILELRAKVTTAGSSTQAAPTASASNPDGIQPSAFRFLISTEEGLILTNADGKTFKPASIKGHDVTVSPDGKSVAYVNRADTRLLVFRDGKEYPLNSFGQHKMPNWGPKGKTLAYLASGSDGHGHQGDFVYWLKMDSGFERATALYLGYAKSIGGPPLTDPKTGKLLIIENISLKESLVFRFDPICGCVDVREDFTKLPYAVNWATIRPDGEVLVFSEDDGNLYSLDMHTKNVRIFVKDSTQKQRPMFSKDGKYLAYFDDSNNISITTADGHNVQKIPVNAHIQSLDWGMLP